MTQFLLEVGLATDTGPTRERNEDFYSSYLPAEGESWLAGLVLVADGMGGERGGEQASRLAVDQVLDKVNAGMRRGRDDSEDSGSATTGPDLGDFLQRATRDASDQIYQIGQNDPSVHRMGSTLVMAAVQDDQAYIVHVGDSRCYRIREGRIDLLTRDHTWVASQVKAGTLTPEAAEQHPQRNVLTRTLGDATPPNVDLRTESLEDEDLFILCTDGLTNALSAGEILQISKRFLYSQDLAEALVALATDQDGSDNATAVVMRCRCRTGADPDETEPILRSEAGAFLPATRRRWIVLGVLLMILLVTSALVPRIIAVRAFDRGIAFAEDGHFLHARQEFSSAIRWGLDAERTDQLIDWLLRFPSPTRQDDESQP